MSRPRLDLEGAAILAGLAGVLVLIAVLFAIGPWLLFWSVGVLFGVSIPLTLKTWLAAVVFLMLVRGGGSSG